MSNNMTALVHEIQEQLEKEKIDGWLLYDFRKSNLFSIRILSIPPRLTQTRRCLYFIPRSGEPVKIVHRIEEGNMDHLPGIKKVYLSWQSLSDHIRVALGNARRVAMEYSPKAAIPYVSRVDAGTVELIRSLGVDVVSSANLVQFFEARWNEEQFKDNLETAEHLRQIVHRSFAFIKDQLHSIGYTEEYAVQQFMLKEFELRNLVADTPPNCSVNANSANPHYEPTKENSTRIQTGDFVLIDLWARKKKENSVYADITWVGVADSKVPEEVNKVFQIVAQARDAALSLVKIAFSQNRPVYGYEVDNHCRKIIIDAGYGEYFIHRTGHSIGQEVHANGANMDDLETHDDRRIIPSTSFTIEPGIYLPGKFGVRSEIDVFVTPEGEILVTGEPSQKEVFRILT